MSATQRPWRIFEPEFLEAYEAASRLTAEVLSSEPGAMLQHLDRDFASGKKRKKK